MTSDVRERDDPAPARRGVIRTWLGGVIPPGGPVRTLTLAVLVNSLGSGFTLPVSTLYFTRTVGLPVDQVAFCLGAGSVAGLFAGVPLGRLADRRGPREVQVALLTSLGLVSLGYVLVAAVWQYLLIVIGTRILGRGVAAAGGALIASSTTGPTRVRARAQMRVAMNVGLVTGSGAAALALQLNSATAYRATLVVDGLTYLLAAAVYLRMPRVPPVPRDAAPRAWRVFRDRSYLAIVALTGVLSMYQAVLTIAVPLWITEDTSAPRLMVSLLIAVNTIGCVALQVPISRRTETVAASVRASRLAGAGLVLACLAFGTAHGRSPTLAILLLLAGGVFHLFGELLASSAQFCLSFELADANAQGQYQGMFSTGLSLMGSLAPTLMAVLPLGLGLPGWLALAGIFALAAAGFGPAVALRKDRMSEKS